MSIRQLAFEDFHEHIKVAGLRIDKAIDTGYQAIADREAHKLRCSIIPLPTGSVVIKEAAASLAQVAEEIFWTDLSHQQLEFLRNEIKPLFRTVSEVDFKALRFERDLLEYSLAQLSKETELAETLKEAIVEQIFELPLSVNFVPAEATLIRHAQTNAFWSFDDELHREDSLDELNQKLGPLMTFRESQPTDSTTYLDLKDEVLRKEFVEFGPKNEAVSISRYREVVESLIVELTDCNPVLLKIRNGEEVTESEATELAELLHFEHPHITEQLLQQVYQNRRARFLQFIRHILGIEVLKSFPETVTEAFDQFVQQHSNLKTGQKGVSLIVFSSGNCPFPSPSGQTVDSGRGAWLVVAVWHRASPNSAPLAMCLGFRLGGETGGAICGS